MGDSQAYHTVAMVGFGGLSEMKMCEDGSEVFDFANIAGCYAKLSVYTLDLWVLLSSFFSFICSL